MSAWDDLPRLTVDLRAALDAFDWSEVTRIRERLVERIGGTAERLPAVAAADLIGPLRRKRRFADIEHLAEALLQSGQEDASVLRQYGQALIDQGKLTAARGLLDRVAADPNSPEKERLEGVGLLGRLYKQLYVNARQPGNPIQRANLERSLRYYHQGYAAGPEENLWHGVNIVALLARARREGVSFDGFPVQDEAALAASILRAPGAAGGPWRPAIRMEASVALGKWDDAFDAAREYTADDRLDAFEYASTLRQLEEVWGLTADREPGARLLPALRSATMKRVGGEVNVSAGDVRAVALQANFDDEKRIPLGWWRVGLARCASVARIETEAGRKFGTGFLVDPLAFLADDPVAPGPVLLTNWHVISKDGEFPGSLPPAAAFARFEASGTTARVTGLVASSRRLDASFVSLEKVAADAAPFPIEPPPAAFDRAKRQRVYVIGYPLGGDLSFSIHDSIWLDTDGTRLHYRTPTDPGSSGSPVFDELSWTVLALHRAGGGRVPRLHGTGTYEANEGMAIAAIREAVRATRNG